MGSSARVMAVAVWVAFLFGGTGVQAEVPSDGSAPVSAHSAAMKLGEHIVLEDIVSQVLERDGGTLFLNFGGEYPNEVFRAVILPGPRARFGELEIKPGDRVRISGEVTDYMGFPRIVLRDPEQLSVIDG